MAEDSAFSRFRGWLDSGAGRMTAGLAAIAVIAAAVLIFIYKPSGAKEQATYYEEQGQKLWIICTACGHVDQVRVPVNQVFPIECPNCHEVKAEEGFRCTTCRKVFVMPKELVFRCPYCNAPYDYRLAGGGRGPR